VNSVTGHVKSQQNKILIDLEIYHKIISFQTVSGATASAINANTYALIKNPKLLKCSRVLHAFGHTPIPLPGELHTIAKCGEKEKQVVLIVTIAEASTHLFGIYLLNRLIKQKFGSRSSSAIEHHQLCLHQNLVALFASVAILSKQSTHKSTSSNTHYRQKRCGSTASSSAKSI